uniref:MATE family efflux transporter n=1 Tax=Glaesserella sp. TaxID=2094731 RepID=UPI0035A160CA
MRTIHREFYQFVTFSIMSMVGQSLFILADTFFIANGVGAQGLAALNIVLPVVNIINGLGWMFGVGGATQFAITKSQGMLDKANNHFTQTVVAASLIAILFTLLSQMFVDDILGFLGVTPALFEMSRSYFTILTLFTPLFILNNVFISFIRNDFNPRLAMIGMILGGIINIIFDYIFIYPMEMGLTGAAIATVFSPAVSLMICSFHFKYSRRTLAFQPIRLRFGSILATLRNGFSSFLNEFSSAFVMLIFNLIVLDLAGDIGVSAYSIVANMNIIAVAIFTGIGEGGQPLISAYHGKDNREAVNTVLRLGLRTALIIGGLFVAIGLFLPDLIVAIFNGDGNIELA